MGAVPKRKISKARKNRRRAHDALSLPPMSTCPKCKQTKRPHFKCPHCGHYGVVERAAKQVAGRSKTPPKKALGARSNKTAKQ